MLLQPEECRDHCTPTQSLGPGFEQPRPPVDTHSLDAVRHLLELGHQTVHHLGGPDGWLGTEARHRGWLKELSSNKRVINDPWVGDWSAESGYNLGSQLLGDPSVTAVYAANDQMAIGLLAAAHAIGRRVPEDLSVVGFDDVPEARFLCPPLTTVHLDFSVIGRACVQQLLLLIGGKPSVPGLLVAPELLVRNSTSPPRSR